MKKTGQGRRSRARDDAPLTVAEHRTARLARHRALLLALVGILCLWASWAPGVRPAALLAAAINVVGFLGFYALYGNPAGALRTFAIADLVALPPLAFAAWMTIVRARIRTSMTESPGSMPYSRDSVSGTNTGATGIR